MFSAPPRRILTTAKARPIALGGGTPVVFSRERFRPALTKMPHLSERGWFPREKCFPRRSPLDECSPGRTKKALAKPLDGAENVLGENLLTPARRVFWPKEKSLSRFLSGPKSSSACTVFARTMFMD
jgi:hypothetical protein